MALQDLTGIYRNKEFKGGVGGGAKQTSYSGPEPVDYGEDVSAETLQAAVMGIYEKYGRSAKGIRMAKASPEYAALQGAGISVFGTPTARIGDDGKLTGGTMNLSGASEEMKKKAGSQYAALEGGGSRGRTSRTPSSSLTDAVNGGAEVTPPAPVQNKPRVPESTPQTAQSTSMGAVNPPATPATPATETPKVEPTKTPVKETSKGPRLETSKGPRPLPFRDVYPTGGPADKGVTYQGWSVGSGDFGPADPNAGSYKGGQEARAASDKRASSFMSPQAQMQRVNAYRKQEGMDEIDFEGQEPKLDHDTIDRTIARQEAAGVAMSRTRDAGERMALSREILAAQEDREGVKKDFNEKSQLLDFERRRNNRLFGNPYGPDNGESRRQSERPPELAPLGGYKRLEGSILAEGDGMAVGPMTNKPASSQAEYEQRMEAFKEAGVRQREDNKRSAEARGQRKKQAYVDELNKKYAGPGPFPRKA
jgi:hypothetical protein